MVSMDECLGMLDHCTTDERITLARRDSNPGLRCLRAKNEVAIGLKALLRCKMLSGIPPQMSRKRNTEYFDYLDLRRKGRWCALWRLWWCCCFCWGLSPPHMANQRKDAPRLTRLSGGGKQQAKPNFWNRVDSIVWVACWRSTSFSNTPKLMRKTSPKLLRR